MSKRDNAEQRTFLDDEHQEALVRNLTKRMAEVEGAIHAVECCLRAVVENQRRTQQHLEEQQRS